MQKIRFYIFLLATGIFTTALSLHAEEPVSLRLSERRTTQFSTIELEFTFGKPKGQRVYFVGSSPTNPAYQIQLRQDDAWQDHFAGCGNGWDYQEMPTETSQLKIVVDPTFAGKTTFRIGMKVYSKQPTWEAYDAGTLPESTMVWSDPVTP